MNTMLCLDGPLNGQWSSLENARQYGYHIESWPSGEEVLVHGALDAEPDFEAHDGSAA
jgi:hypothetical protein